MTRPKDGPPLHELDPTTRFSERVDDYVRFRPNYPPAAIDHVLGGLASQAITAADVGAGTGISTRHLAERGVRVLALEPNADMRNAATAHPRVTWHDGTAEATGLPDAAVDLVLSAQAFHWFRQPDAIAEFHRITRPGGRLALMWNNRDRRDPLTLGYIEAIRAVDGEDPVEARPFDPGVVNASGLFSVPELREFPHEQPLDREGLIGRARSASYVPKDGAGFATLRRLLEDLFTRHQDGAGRVALRYRTQVWISERR